MKDKPLKPYYRKNGKLFYRKGRLKMELWDNVSNFPYKIIGDIIENILIPNNQEATEKINKILNELKNE